MKRIASILYVMGSRPGDIKDLEQAIVLAKESQARVTVLDIVESLPPASRMLITAVPSGELKNSVLAGRQEQLEGLLSMIRPDGVDLRVRVLFGNRAREISHEATAGSYDVVVKQQETGRIDKYLSRNCSTSLQLLKSDGSLASGESLESLGFVRDVKPEQARDHIGLQARAHTFAG